MLDPFIWCHAWEVGPCIGWGMHADQHAACAEHACLSAWLLPQMKDIVSHGKLVPDELIFQVCGWPVTARLQYTLHRYTHTLLDLLVCTAAELYACTMAVTFVVNSRACSLHLMAALPHAQMLACGIQQLAVQYCLYGPCINSVLAPPSLL